MQLEIPACCKSLHSAVKKNVSDAEASLLPQYGFLAHRPCDCCDLARPRASLAGVLCVRNVPRLLLIKRYNLYEVLACSTTFFQLSLFCATFFQLRTSMFFIPSKTSSSQRVLGLPFRLLDMGFNIPCSYIKQFLFHPFNMTWSS